MTTKPFPVLVTGGAGYIGSHAVLALRDAGWTPIVIDNLVTGFRWAVPDGVTFINANIGDPAAVAKAISEHKIGAIIHFAGSVVVPESVENPLKYYDNNTGNSRNLIGAAIESGVRHMIFSSTAATYGIPDQIPVDENTPTVPINPYGRSKLMTEYMLRDVAEAHDFNFCALRYFNVAGADMNGRSGQSTAGATHLIKVAVEAVLGKRESVGVFGTDFETADGTGVRDYIHVNDLADAHVMALEKLVAEPEQSHILNCGYGHGFSVLEVLDAVDRATNKPVRRVLEGRRPGDPDALVANNAAIKQTLGWEPKFDDLDKIVASALAWERGLAEKLS